MEGGDTVDNQNKLDENSEKPVVFTSNDISVTMSKDKKNLFTNVSRSKQKDKTARKPIKISYRKILIISIIILLLALGGYFGYPAYLESIKPTMPKGLEAMKNGDYTAGISIYEEALKQAKTDKAKEDILTARLESITKYCEYECLDQALKDAYALEELTQSAYSAYYIYHFEEIAGSETEAEKWLEIIDERGGVNFDKD